MEKQVDEIAKLLVDANSVLFLTGAGISAESGIPTFRGEEGMWTIGSKNYFPEEMARNSFFKLSPEKLFQWYEYRQKICAKAKPNGAHNAITNIESWCFANSKKFHLVTQNVDNLHRIAKTKNITEVHGNIFKYRCSNDYSDHNMNFHDVIQYSDMDPSYEIINNLPQCPNCSSILRPHILWFDETYNEEFFGFKSSLEFAKETDILFIIGTTLKTSLPIYIVQTVLGRKIPIVEINPDPVLANQIQYSITSKSVDFMEKLISKLII